MAASKKLVSTTATEPATTSAVLATHGSAVGSAPPASSAIADPAPGTTMNPGSGAFVEPAILASVDVDHPAVENNPRAGTTAVQNGVDWNDPVGRTPADPDFVGQGVDRSVYGL